MHPSPFRGHLRAGFLITQTRLALPSYQWLFDLASAIYTVLSRLRRDA